MRSTRTFSRTFLRGALLAGASLVGALGPMPAVAAATTVQTGEDAIIEESADFVARDARIDFDQRSAAVARIDVDELLPGDYGRSAALVALGAARSVRARPKLMDELNIENLPEERAAAALALGELGERGLGKDSMKALVGLVNDPDPTVARAALVALVRTGSASGREAVDRVARGSGVEAIEARQILAHHIDPRGTAPPLTYRRLYQLRWSAGCTYGIVDGKVWGATLMEELATNSQFLEAFVLQLTRELELPGAKDHLLEILRFGRGAPRLIEAVRVMPAEVEMLIDSGVWRPQTLKEWKWLVMTVLHEELGALFPQSLLRSMSLENSPTRWIAAGLLYREDPQFKDILDEGFEHDDAAVRAFSIYAAASVELTEYLNRLRELMEDPDPWVQANAIGGLIRMGSEIGASRAFKLLDMPVDDRPQRVVSLLFEVLEREAPDEEVMYFVEQIAPNLRGADRAAADALLLIHGGLIDSEPLRRQLPLLNPNLPEAHRGVRALAQLASKDDVRLLARMFPRDAATKMNVELAVALAKVAHRAPEPLLQAAVWNMDWNQSILAAGCVYDTYGLPTLLAWVSDPPPTATTEDVRRLGYAIGEWGGLEAVQELQRKLGTTNGAELPALQGAIMGALGARTR